MRVAVLQFAVGEYTKMLEVSRVRHLDGCRKFGYAYRCEFTLRAKHPYWHKLVMVQEAIRDGFDYVIWLDADVIWNGVEPLTDAIDSDGIGMVWSGGEWQSPYYPHYNCGVYFVRCVDAPNAMLEKLRLWAEESDDGHPWGDQHAFHKLLENGEISVCKVADRFNWPTGKPTIRVWHGLGISAIKDMENYNLHLSATSNRTGHVVTMQAYGRAFQVEPASIPLVNNVFHDEYRIESMRHGHGIETIVDIGAHVGAFSVYSKEIWPDAKVIAVEPHPDSFALMELNTKHCSNIDLVNCAIGSIDGQSLLCSSPSESRVGEYLADVWDSLDSRFAEFGTCVPTISVEKFWTTHVGDRQVDILKLDCEGAEYLILNELNRIGYLKQVRWIRGEWHHRPSNAALCSALDKTHVCHVDDNQPHGCGPFIAHRRW